MGQWKGYMQRGWQGLVDTCILPVSSAHVPAPCPMGLCLWNTSSKIKVRILGQWQLSMKPHPRSCWTWVPMWLHRLLVHEASPHEVSQWCLNSSRHKNHWENFLKISGIATNILNQNLSRRAWGFFFSFRRFQMIIIIEDVWGKSKLVDEGWHLRLRLLGWNLSPGWVTLTSLNPLFLYS